jgi:hypothetical protein
MKRTFAILMAALLLLPACTQEIKTETLKLDEDIPFREGSDNSLSLDLDIDFPVSGFSKDALEEVRRTIRTHTLGENYTDFTGSLDEMGQYWRDAMVEDYLISNEGMLEEMEMSEEDAPFLNWGYDYKGAFGEPYKQYVNYIIDQYQYLGGAHGMYGTFPIVFDTKTGERMEWQELVPNVSEERMAELLLQHRFDDLDEVIDEDDLDRDNIFFSDTVEPSPWFSVDKDGLTFYYQPYDLAPYVFGIITIPVPWEELK